MSKSGSLAIALPPSAIEALTRRKRVVSSKLDEVTRAREYMILGTERHLAGAIRR
jgi:hypothetical protein